jgi:hypothetical protein
MQGERAIFCALVKQQDRGWFVFMFLCPHNLKGFLYPTFDFYFFQPAF